MKLNTLDKLYNALLYELPEIQLEESLRLAAKIPMDRMMEISKKAGLVG
jgi:quinolinate synthase